MNSVFGCIDYQISERANMLHRAPLCPNGSEKAFAFISRVRTTRLGKAALEDRIRRLEKHNIRFQYSLSKFGELLREFGKEMPLANIDHEGRFLDCPYLLLIRDQQPGKGR